MWSLMITCALRAGLLMWAEFGPFPWGVGENNG